MGLNLLDRLQARLELFRLEQRYTRRRNRRSTFVSNAVYVDGEYIYNTPNTTGSSSNSDSIHDSAQQAAGADETPAESAANNSNGDSNNINKRAKRWSSMPGFGSMSKASSSDMASRKQEWRRSQFNPGEVR